HALGDIFAKGGTPDHALAVAGLPPAAANLQEDDLFQLLAGARSVFDRERVALVGGHTARTEALSIGFFVSGSVSRDKFLPKSGLAGGDVLVLTKPLGTGILFAAWMRRLAKAREVNAALDAMRTPSGAAMQILARHGPRGATDITGFGLAGHLIEMLDASGCSAEIALSQVPRYPGVDRLIASGIRSSLLPENLAVADRIDVQDLASPEAALALLFDPQTSGGLLAALPEDQALLAIEALGRANMPAAIIGRVLGRHDGSSKPAFALTVRERASDVPMRNVSATVAAVDG
ncbi:MAG: selenide, water dikinase SelD, partial [Proteobacteria bacterium]|nr:selenide, water dikinase SelD [Pseudomonadota bacterium]